MLEDDLIAILRNRRAVLNNALEALHQYRNITSQVTNNVTYRKMVVKKIREPGHNITTIHTHIIIFLYIICVAVCFIFCATLSVSC